MARQKFISILVEVALSNVFVADDRYSFTRVRPSTADLEFAEKQVVNDGKTLEMEAFLARATSCNIPVQIVHLAPGVVASIPASFCGITAVKFAGSAPLASLDHDKFGNLQMSVPKNCVLEVVFNSEDSRTKRPQEKKIIYLMR